jgi:peroxiredoxin
MKLGTVLLAAATAAVLGAQQAAPPKTHLKVGDAAPDFTLQSSAGKPVSLKEYRGKPVVLAFFPAAFTGGCTKELTAYQSGIGNFKESDAQVLAISTDNAPTLSHWAKELNAEFLLLSDFMRKTSAAYGVLMPERGVAARVTFVVGPDGKIVHIDEGSAAIDPTGAAAACKRVRK